MDQQPNQFEEPKHGKMRRFVLLVILFCACGSIVYELMSETAPVAVPQVDAVAEVYVAISEQKEDPMPPLEADLIPWQNDATYTEQATHLQHGVLGRVLVVRGILTIFSLGMDDLAKKMRNAGYEVKVTTAAQSNHEARVLRDHVQSIGSQKPVIIIGHSLGGDKAPKLAKIFAEKNLPVDLLVMLDSTMPSAPPDNVKVCVNMFQDNGTPDWARLFRGTSISSSNSKTQLINVDIRKLAGKDTTAGINHFNIDANPWIHDVVIKMVGQYLNGRVNEQSGHWNSVLDRNRNQIRKASQIPAHSQKPQHGRH